MKATWLLAALASVAFSTLPASSPNAAPLAPGALGTSLKDSSMVQEARHRHHRRHHRRHYRGRGFYGYGYGLPFVAFRGGHHRRHRGYGFGGFGGGHHGGHHSGHHGGHH